MTSSRTTPSLFAVAIALALAIGGALAPSSEARVAPKAGAPSLTIEAKRCLIGPAEDDRSVTVTALALLGSTGDRVTMRFSVQSRQGKTRWKRLLFKDPGNTGTWETTEAAGAGLKLTKTIPKLPENFDYRVVVETRAVDESGKVVTKTARKYVPCKQPMFTATLNIGKTGVFTKAPADAVQPAFAPNTDGSPTPALDAAGPPYLVIPIKNVGRITSEPAVLTVARADTRETLSRWAVDPLKGGATVKLLYGVAPDCSQLYITVQPEGAAPTALTVAQAGIVDCRVPADQPAAKRGRR
ncbi:MAG: hypothetical protein JHD16_15745 [Solirubrobacteraceae bacterium]|nr:hypothetical protein [Solirubrobacteraceae bacterium]